MSNFKKLQRTLTVLFLLCMIPIGMNAQTVRGTVNDEAGEPIIGATVKVQGGNDATITDLDGNFTIKAASNATLTITYVGYVSQQVQVGGRNNITITLKRRQHHAERRRSHWLRYDEEEAGDWCHRSGEG